MSQSRFSIVLVGVSALLRRPLVSRLRPADGERSPWVVFAARGCRFESEMACATSALPLGGLVFGLISSAFRHAPLRRLPSAGWPSGSLLPLFGMPRFGNCPRRVGSSAGRVGLRAHFFRFSARTASELPSAGWFFRLPFRRLPSAGWPSGSPLPLFGMHRSAPPHRRSEDRRSTPTRHLFHFKTLIPTC